MNLDDLTLGDLKKLQTLVPSAGIPEHPYPVGKAVMIRTVTMIYTGQLVRVTAGELVITDAAWIADTGRFSTFLATGDASEVEPYPPGEVIVPRGPVCDVCLWLRPLPRVVK